MKYIKYFENIDHFEEEWEEEWEEDDIQNMRRIHFYGDPVIYKIRYDQWEDFKIAMNKNRVTLLKRSKDFEISKDKNIYVLVGYGIADVMGYLRYISMKYIHGFKKKISLTKL